MPYSPDEYWRGLHQREGLSAVGQSALPDSINAWLYRSLARNLRAFVRRHRVRPSAGAGAGDRMLDVGVGKGYWVPFWTRQGWAVDGVDLVPAAVADVQGRFPEGRFWVADVTAPDAFVPPDGGAATWQLVTCLNVLLHVTQDDRFAEALTRLAGIVAPGGHLLLAEPILTSVTQHAPYDPDKHSRARVLATYAEPLQAAGLELVAVEHGTVLANNPIEAGSPKTMARYRRWWTWVTTRTKANPSSARWIGPLVSGLDRVAMHSSAAPTTKFALLRRPPARP
jgi:2-polyprenyl-3-methyl-5-hydroxy-6-metoxy-1,4-benzoquinol methylase